MKKLGSKRSGASKESACGVVRAYIRGFKPAALVKSRGKLAKAVGASRPVQVIQAVHSGLPIYELEELRTQLDIPLDRLAPKLGLSKATLHRRKLQGRLAPDESDRVVRYARLMGKAIEVMEDLETARQWMTSPQIGLGGAAPIDFADTEVGAREVEDLLGRIDHGVYS